MSTFISNPTQAERILAELQKANGGWISGRFFGQNMMISQFHRAIWELQNKRDRYQYDGEIESSDFRDEYDFVYYRLTQPDVQLALKL